MWVINGFRWLSIGLSPKGGLIPAAEGGTFPLSHYTRSWKAKLVIRLLLHVEGISMEMVVAWLGDFRFQWK